MEISGPYNYNPKWQGLAEEPEKFEIDDRQFTALNLIKITWIR